MSTPRRLIVILDQGKVVGTQLAPDTAPAGTATGAMLKKNIAGGEPELAAHSALMVSKEVEDKVKACADDLHTVNATLAQGVSDLEHTETALATDREALVGTRAALAASQEGEREARFAARHDPATGLPNREYFDSRLTHDIAVAARHGFELALMFFDLASSRKSTIPTDTQSGTKS